MGILSDFFVATPEDLKRLDLSRGPAGVFPTVQAKRVDPVKLATLQAVVEGGSDIGELITAIDAAMLGDEEGPWLVTVPPSVTSALAGADSAGLSRLAASWAATEEWVADGGTAANLSPFVAQLGELARAASPGRSLYLWICL